MKSKYCSIKEFKKKLESKTKEELVDICVEYLKLAKKVEKQERREMLRSIVEDANLDANGWDIMRELKEKGFTLKEIEAEFPRNVYPALYEVETHES